MPTFAGSAGVDCAAVVAASVSLHYNLLTKNGASDARRVLLADLPISSFVAGLLASNELVIMEEAMQLAELLIVRHLDTSVSAPLTLAAVQVPPCMCCAGNQAATIAHFQLADKCQHTAWSACMQSLKSISISLKAL